MYLIIHPDTRVQKTHYSVVTLKKNPPEVAGGFCGWNADSLPEVQAFSVYLMLLALLILHCNSEGVGNGFATDGTALVHVTTPLLLLLIGMITNNFLNFHDTNS
jgi:hypothetical protein